MSRTPGGNYGALMAAQSIYETSEDAKCAVGTRLPMGDRVFYYAKAAADVTAGNLLASDKSDAGPLLLADGSCVAITAANRSLGDTSIAITAGLAVGDKGIGITHGSSLDNVSKHDLMNGYILLTDSGGVDQIYKIRDNTAMSGDVVEVLLYDEIQTATTDSTTGVVIMPNMFFNLRAAVVDTDEVPTGVSNIAVTQSSEPYFWCQTWGPAIVTGVDDTATAGTDMVLDEGDAGTSTTTDAVGDPRIGIGMADATTAGDAHLVLLQIMP